MAQRYDRGKLSRIDATPQGGLRVDANLTRTGVLTYTYPDGKRVRELRSPEEVFKADSLASLKGAPLVVGHPAMIGPQNYREHTVGHVGDDVRQDGRFVTATVRIQEASAIESVQKGDLVEISCGYTCDVVKQSGEYNGEKYDCIQRNVRYNHAGMGPRDWGRAGNEVGLKLDGEDAAYSDALEIGGERNDSSGSGGALGQVYASSSMTPEEIAALKAQAKLNQERADAAEAKLKAQDTAELDALRGANKALTAENATLKTAADKARTDSADALSPAALDKALTSRLEVVAKARTIAGEKFDHAGKTEEQIMREALAAVHPAVKFDSLGEVKGAFTVAAASAATVAGARQSVGDVFAPPAPGARTDAVDPTADPIAAAMTAMHTRKLSTDTKAS